MGVRNEECVNPVFILGSCSLLAATATLLRTILTQRLTLHVTSIRKSHHHILRCNQIFCEEFGGIHFNE